MNQVSLLEEVKKPVSEAKGLPNRHYVDPATFATESVKLLQEQWAGIGFGKDIPNRGDVVPITFLGIPLLAVRDQSGVVRVFHNVCRHRGMQLVDSARNLGKVIRCPYHSWCYDLDGKLRASPHVGGPGHNVHESIDREELGLLEVPSAVWRDVIFVNIAGNALDFEVYAAELQQRWAEFEQPVYYGGADSAFTLDVATNWKLAVENYCESYHLPWVHPGLNAYSRLEDHYHIEQDDCFSGQGTLVYQQLEFNSLKFKDFQELSAQWNKGAEYVALFPNVLFGVHRDHAFAIVLEPLGMERTREHIVLYYADEQALGADYAELRQKNAALWKQVFSEDIHVVEGMQQGRHCPAFDGGKFSPVMDSPTHLFHRWVARRYES